MQDVNKSGIFQRGIDRIQSSFDDRYNIANHIKALDKAAIELGEFVKKREGRHVEYDGGCHGVGIYRDKKVAIQKAVMDKDSVFAKHHHDGRTEILIVTTGKLEVWIDGLGTQIVTKDNRNPIYFTPGQEHSVKALEYTEMVGIIVPANGEGYPDAR